MADQHEQPSAAADEADGADGADRADRGAPGATPRRSPRGTHCWVLMPDVEPMPGVVAGWRRDEQGAWQARVAYALGDDGTGGVVMGWLPASCLRPLHAP